MNTRRKTYFSKVTQTPEPLRGSRFSRTLASLSLAGMSAIACLPEVQVTDNDLDAGVTGGGSDSGPVLDGDAGAKVGEIDEYFEALPSWEEFSPQSIERGASTEPVKGETEELEPVILEGEKEYTGETVKILPPHEYTCETTSYSLESNPKDIVMLDPDSELLWPGALLQGRTHKDKVGSLAELPIRQRAPLKITIDELKDSRTVTDVSKGGMSKAIGEMLKEEAAKGLATPGKSHFEMEVYQNDAQFAVRMDVSGRYLGFSASASGSVERSKAETTLTALYYDRMFTVDVELPQSPEEVFNDDFTAELLQKEVDRGRIGPNNLPVYLSQIVYGRILMFSMTSSASEEQMRGAVNAAWKNVGASAKVSVSAEQKNILQEAKYSIASIGGDRESIEAMIRTGDWREYFTGSAALSTAEPMIYTFRNLGDNSIASVVEATDYEVETCSATPVTDAPFIFTELSSHQAPLPAPMKLLQGDFNGDGNTDILWNHLSANNGNQFYVAHGNEDGGFDLPKDGDERVSYQHPSDDISGDSWGQPSVSPLVGDFNGDERDDIAWVFLGSGPLSMYVAFSEETGGFRFSDLRVVAQGNGGWNDYIAYAGDVDADGKTDLYVNAKEKARNVVRIARSVLDANGNWQPEMLNRQFDRGTDYEPYETFVQDLDGDGDTDVVWNAYGKSRNDIWQSLFDFGGGDWNGNSRLFQPGVSTELEFAIARLGKVNPDAFPDFLWVPTKTGKDKALSVRFSAAEPDPNDNRIGYPTTIETTVNVTGWDGIKDLDVDATVALGSHLADLNADGSQELVIEYQLDQQKFLAAGSVGATGEFDFTREKQVHPASERWGDFTTIVGDVDGDGRQDLIWNHASALENKLYVALSR